jgi:hypothetical protein
MAMKSRSVAGWVLLGAAALACATSPSALRSGMTKAEASQASGLDFVNTRPNFRVSNPEAVYEEYFVCASDLGGWYITMYPTCGRTARATRITFLDGRVDGVHR